MGSDLYMLSQEIASRMFGPTREVLRELLGQLKAENDPDKWGAWITKIEHVLRQGDM